VAYSRNVLTNRAATTTSCGRCWFYGAICNIKYDVFFKVMGISCDVDTCGEETSVTGRDATMANARRQARNEGWSVSDAGHFCPDHRQRRKRTASK
jgi:hypothetical protein